MIKIDNLKKTYDRHTSRAHEVLHGVSLELPDTGFVCILGASGCGKTTLLNAIGGLDNFDEGSITANADVITRSPSPTMERVRNASFGYIFQNYYLLTEHSAAYNVFIGMHSLELPKKEKMSRVRDALERVGMQRYAKRPVGELSGGQQQRVAIARAIARRPRVIFADEPTGNLDEINTVNICSILKDISKESLVVMVTHEERIANFFADRIIRLEEGRITSDTTDWDRGQIDAGEKDAIYSADYAESRIGTDELSVRLLYDESAEKADITIVVEKNRIIIKSNDKRVMISSDTGSAPYLREGARPVLSPESFSGDKATSTSSEREESPQKKKKRPRASLGFKMLLSEARGLVSGSKLKKFGTGVFIIILSLLVAISVADVITVAHIDPEDFITTDPHNLTFKFERGTQFADKYAPLYPYIKEYRNGLYAAELDADFIPPSGNVLIYTDNMIPQLGNVQMSFGSINRVNINRLDPDDIISGRMPERSDEIVIDRWLAEKVISADGILQNTIPTVDYLIGKSLSTPHKTYKVTIVGICDSGGPSMYMSTEAIMAYGANGAEVITLSEYKRLTGDTRIQSLKPHEAVVLVDHLNFYYPGTSSSLFISNGYEMRLIGGIRETDDSIMAKIVIADEDLMPLYNAMIYECDSFTLWCKDKDAVKAIAEQPLPEELDGMLNVKIEDKYADDYAAYEARTRKNLDARTIITVTLIAASVVMLYLMQRSKVREQMDLVTVYRLLGIAKSNLVTVFAIENLILTAKYALPTVAAVYLYVRFNEFSDPTAAMIYPLWAAALTVVVISAFRLIVAVLPLLRMLTMPPARLAAKYDF